MKKKYLLLIFIGLVFYGFGQEKSDITLTSDDPASNTVTYNGRLDSPDDPSGFSITATSASQMEIVLNANATGNNIVVVFDEDNSFTAPSGSAPNVGQPFAGGTVVYKGKLSPQIHSGLASSTSYYYRAWSVDEGDNYSTGLPGGGTTNAETLSTIYSEDFSDCSSSLEWDVVSVASDKDWICGLGVQAINGEGGNEASDDYLISPAFNMDFYIDEVFSFESWTDNVDVGLSQPISLLYTTDYINDDPAGTAWNELTAIWSPTDSQEPTHSGDIDISGITGIVRFAFRYQSSGFGVGTTTSWKIDDIYIQGNPVSNIWKTNAATAEWNDPANWMSGIIPGAASDVIIQSGGTIYPIITGETQVCKDLTMELGSSIVIAVDGALTVNGTFLNAGGPGTVTIKSSDAANGSFIPYTVIGQVEVERSIVGHNGVDADGWHLISQPVTDETFNVAGSDFEVSSPSLDDLFNWNESTFTWENYKANPFDFEIGKGYLCAYETTVLKEFVGWPNASNVNIDNLVFTNSDNDDGWFLLGNPFASPVQWDALGWSLNNVAYIAQVFNSTNRNYEPVMAGELIPAMQGFFVEVDTNSIGSLTIPSAARVADNADWFKSTNEQVNTLALKVTGGNVPYYDKTIIRFNDLASNKYDSQFDGHKLFGFAETPRLYSTRGAEMFSVNTLKPNNEEIIVPVAFLAGVNGEFTINVEYNTINTIGSIYLEDKATDEVINLSQQSRYTFQAAIEDNANRFLLHFNGVTTVEELSDENAPQIYAVEDVVYINHAQDLDADIFIYATNGQLVGQDQMSKESMKCVSIPGSTGIYLVSIQTEDAVYTEKVYIK